MAGKRVFAYRSPNEDEYIFNCLVNYPAWAKSKLTPQELSIFKSPSTIRKYINNASTDQKKLLLAKGNIRFIGLYIDYNKDEPLNLKNFTKIYKSIAVAKERRKIIEHLAENNSFVISSRETLNAGYLLAQNCHTPYYTINQNYRRVYDAVDSLHLRGQKKYDEHGDTTDLRFHHLARKVNAKHYLASLASENYVKVTHKLDQVDMRLIGILFVNDDTFVTRKALQREMFSYKANSISVKLSKLVQAGYIDVNRSNATNVSYTIAELGLIIMNETLDRLATQALNT